MLVGRPVAAWVHEHLGDARFHWFKGNSDGHLLTLGPFSLMAAPAQALVPGAAFRVRGSRDSCRGRLASRNRARIILALSLGVFAVTGINTIAKTVFGRTWPESWMGDNPSWIRDGVFGFFPFHQGPGWGSFLFGHTAVITTTGTILWLVWPELRIAWALLIGANYNFVSDIIGGLYLGVAIGLGMAALTLSPNDRLVSTGRSS